MSTVNLDESTIQSIIIQIELIVSEKRKFLDALKSKYDGIETYDTLVKTKDFPKMYGGCVDDFGKINSILSEISEALMDIKSIKRALRTLSLSPTIDKKIRYSIEFNEGILSDFKDAIVCQKEALSARLRFYNSCQYMQMDKVFGDKC